jgi:hypothetical protein
MTDRDDVRARLVDLPMQKSLGVEILSAAVYGFVVQIELEDVSGAYQLGSQRAREQVAAGIEIVPHAHVSPSVQHAFARQHAVRGHQVRDEFRVRASGRSEARATRGGIGAFECVPLCAVGSKSFAESIPTASVRQPRRLQVGFTRPGVSDRD